VVRSLLTENASPCRPVDVPCDNSTLSPFLDVKIVSSFLFFLSIPAFPVRHPDCSNDRTQPSPMIPLPLSIISKDFLLALRYHTIELGLHVPGFQYFSESLTGSLTFLQEVRRILPLDTLPLPPVASIGIFLRGLPSSPRPFSSSAGLFVIPLRTVGRNS